MNNNNNSNNRNNNRRRGRGNSNRPQGGGQQLNRIDSRARGNAPQMLEKYRKLASDAHLNGDRVQAEYYLQFADHYFRVIADTRVRQEEQRGGRPNERPGEGGFDEGDENEFGNEGDIHNFDQPMSYQREAREPREERAPREDRQPREDRSQREDRPQREPRSNDEAREDRGPREPRQNDGAREARDYEQRGPQRPRESGPQPAADTSGQAPSEGGQEFEAAANPFTRNTRGLRPRRDREARPDHTGDNAAGEPSGLDPSILPPAITESRAAVTHNLTGTEGEEAPAPRRRGRPRKTPIAEGGEPVEVVTG